MQVKEIQPKKYSPASDTEKAAAKSKMDKMRKEGEKLVKGMFEFTDAKGGWLDFNYRFYPGDPIRTVRIVHGEIADLPLHLVRHLNNIWIKVKTLPQNLDVDKPVVQKLSRTRFTPMDAF